MIHLYMRGLIQPSLNWPHWSERRVKQWRIVPLTHVKWPRRVLCWHVKQKSSPLSPLLTPASPRLWDLDLVLGNKAWVLCTSQTYRVESIAIGDSVYGLSRDRDAGGV